MGKTVQALQRLPSRAVSPEIILGVSLEQARLPTRTTIKDFSDVFAHTMAGLLPKKAISTYLDELPGNVSVDWARKTSGLDSPDKCRGLRDMEVPLEALLLLAKRVDGEAIAGINALDRQRNELVSFLLADPRVAAAIADIETTQTGPIASAILTGPNIQSETGQQRSRQIQNQLITAQWSRVEELYSGHEYEADKTASAMKRVSRFLADIKRYETSIYAGDSALLLRFFDDPDDSSAVDRYTSNLVTDLIELKALTQILDGQDPIKNAYEEDLFFDKIKSSCYSVGSELQEITAGNAEEVLDLIFPAKRSNLAAVDLKPSP